MRYFLFLPLALLATVNDPPRIELLSGYRNDLIHWHLTQEGAFLSGERARNIQFWENALSFQAIHRDIAFYAAAGYGAFGKGELKETLADHPSIQFSTHGWAVDGIGYLGYAVNLTPDRIYRVIILPLVGFSGHYEVMNPNNYQQTWYGPSIGVGFQIEPNGRLQFQIGYEYNWLHLRVSNKTFSLNRWGNFGQSGWAEMQVQLDRAWRLGFGLDMNYYFSGNHPVKVAEINETFKLRWFSISGLVTISRSL